MTLFGMTKGTNVAEKILDEGAKKGSKTFGCRRVQNLRKDLG